MNTQRIKVALDNLEYLDNQLYTLMTNKKLRRVDYAELKKNIDHTKGHLQECIKESEESQC